MEKHKHFPRGGMIIKMPFPIHMLTFLGTAVERK